MHEKDMTAKQVADALRDRVLSSELVDAAADQLERYSRLIRSLGRLAPGGSAPRTAFEQMYIDTADPSTDGVETVAVTALRAMLEPHWYEWTPEIRDLEDLPPAAADPLV